MPITGTLCKLDRDNVLYEVLITEYKGQPMILGLSKALPDFTEDESQAAAAAVRFLSDQNKITSVNIAGVGTLFLAEW